MAKKRDVLVEELLIDIKAAVAIGDVESIANGLSYALDIPEIASNQRLTESDIDNIVLPIGTLLGKPMIDEQLLQALAEDRLTGIRAISGVAQTIRYFENESFSLSGINKAVIDHREEVSLSVTKIINKTPDQIEKKENLIKAWRKPKKEREWVAALNIVHQIEDIQMREDLFDEVFQANLPNANKALVNALRIIKIEDKDYPLVQIIRWQNIENVNPWVIEQITKE